MEAATLRLAARLPRPTLRRLDTDERLVAGVRSGDGRAFEAIFDRYHRPLLSFCRHMLGSREEAEDALQQTFMSAYRSLVSSDRPIELRAWLFTIARNHCVSILRARRESASLDDAASATDGLAAEIQRREDLRHMLADIGRLPDDQRAALVLAELGALSHEEIAQVVGCRTGKVKALVFQARRSLAASREARETPCADVRQQLATLTGGGLRRSGLRRHVRGCAGCREFAAEVRRQRRAMAILLPVVPTIGLKQAVLAGVGLQAVGGAAIAGGAGGASAGGLGVLGGSGGVTKLIAAGVLAVGAGGVALTGGGTQQGKGSRSAPSAAGARPASAPSAGRPASPGSTAKSAKSGKAKGPRRRSHAASGRPESAPGREGTSPGLAGTSPGRAGTTPGQAKTSPGRSGEVPAKSGSSPGQSGTPPGQAGATPGQLGDTPGRSGITPAVKGTKGASS